MSKSSIINGEKEQYSTTLIHLSEVCSNNSTKLDDIRLKVLSLSKQDSPQSSSSMQWILNIQTSTIEELVNFNKELQLQLKNLTTEFQLVLLQSQEKKISTQNTISSPTFETETNISKGKENETKPKNARTTSLLIKEFRENLVNDSLRIQRRSSREWLQKPGQQENLSQETQQRLEPGKEEFQGLAEGNPSQMMPVERRNNNPRMVLTERNENRNVRDENAKQQGYEFTLNVNSQKEFETAREQGASEQASSRENYAVFKHKFTSNYLNHILFGQEKTQNQQNELNKLEETLSFENGKVTPQEIEAEMSEFKSVSDNPMANYASNLSSQSGNYIKVNGSAFSNMQESIVQQLKQNEKAGAEKHLRKIKNNIHQYKSIRERLSERAKPNENATGHSVRRDDFGASADKSSLYSVRGTHRRPTLSEKNANVPDVYNSVRSTVGPTRGQLNFDKIFRRPSCYPVKGERGVNVHVKHFLGENKKALESPNRNLKFQKGDSENIHPEQEYYGQYLLKGNDGVFGLHIGEPVMQYYGSQPRSTYLDPNLSSQIID